MKRYRIQVIGGAIVAAGLRYAERFLPDGVRPYSFLLYCIALFIGLAAIAGFNKLRYGYFLNWDRLNELKSGSSGSAFGRPHTPPEP
jgi:hypothetical protein